MKVTRISVRYGRTHNLGDYNNVRPEIELTAELDRNDDLDTALADLTADARAFVEEEIDQALEERGWAAHFSQEPRYDVWMSDKRSWKSDGLVIEPSVIAVVPAGTEVRPGYHALDRGVRLKHAMQISRARHEKGDVERAWLAETSAYVDGLPRLPDPDPEALPFDESDAAMIISDVLGDQ